MNPLITPQEVGALARPCYADDTIIEAFIAEAEREDVKPRIGDALYVALKGDVLTDEQRLLLDGGMWTDAAGKQRYLTGLKTALAYYTYSRVVRDGNIQSTRYGAVVKNEDNSADAEAAERQRQYRQAFASADALMAEVLAFLDANAATFGMATAPVMKSNRTRFSVIGSDGSATAPARSSAPTIIKGADGESAYEIAVRYGYRGSEFEWLQSLNGESVYDILVEQGLYTGTYKEFVDEIDRMYAESGEALENARNAAVIADKAAQSADDAAKGAKDAAAEAEQAAADIADLEAEVEDAESLRGVSEQEREREFASLKAQAEAVMADTADKGAQAQAAAEAAEQSVAAFGDEIAQERQERLAGDTALSERIEAERDARKIADEELFNGYAAEAQARQAADAALQTSLANLAKVAILVNDEQGDVVAVSDSAAAPVQGVTIYGKSTQDGTPAPDAPIAVVDTANPTLLVQGRNLFNGDVIVGYIGDNDGVLRPKATDNRSTNYIAVKGGADYYIKTEQTIEAWGAWYDAKKKYISACSSYQNKVKKSPANAAFVRLTIANLRVNNGNVDTFCISVSDNQNGTYSPYIAPQAVTLAHTLRGVKVSSGGNYTDAAGQQWVCDTLQVNADGTGEIVRRIDAKIDEQTTTSDHSDCILATPTTEQLTAEEVAALLAMNTYAPTTTAYLDKDGGVALAYVADIKRYIDNKIVGVQALSLDN